MYVLLRLAQRCQDVPVDRHHRISTTHIPRAIGISCEAFSLNEIRILHRFDRTGCDDGADGVAFRAVEKNPFSSHKIVKLKLGIGVGVAAAVPLNHPPLLHLKEEHNVEDFHSWKRLVQNHFARVFPKGQGPRILER